MEGAVYGGIEGGGTKFVCAVGTGPGDLRAEVRFPTTTPQETLGRAADFFAAQQRHTPIAAIGVGSFGPVDPDRASPTFGYILSTPKPGWINTNFVGALDNALGLPVVFDNDLNVAALGEYRWGAGQGLDNFLYMTVGTGIGAGVMSNGRLLHGMLHPESGHLRIPHDAARDPFPGICPYHGNCLEGLASGPAIEARWGRKGDTLPPDHPAWPLQAHYLALALCNLIYTLSPRRIIMGGGVMEQAHLFPAIREEVRALLNGYGVRAELQESLDTYIVPPGLGNRAGILGAIALAQDVHRRGAENAEDTPS